MPIKHCAPTRKPGWLRRLMEVDDVGWARIRACMSDIDQRL